MTKTFNILQKVRKRWEMEETALIWRWLPAFPCGKACAAAPAEPRNDKSGNLPLPEGRRDKLACAAHPCHCEEAEGRRGNLGKAVTNSPEAFLRFGCILRDCRALLRKARNDKLGGLSHSEGRSAELASAALPCHCEEGASPTRQSQVGTFDFAGAFPCSGRYCEIAAPCSARLAMTNLGAFPIRRGAAPSLRVPPSRVIPRSEATWESLAGTCGFAEVRLSPPLRQYIA